MTTSGKILLTIVILAGLFGFGLYKGWRIVPLIDISQTKSIKGNTVTGLRIEMTNPFRESQQVQELFDSQQEEARKLQAEQDKQKAIQEGKAAFEAKKQENANGDEKNQ